MNKFLKCFTKKVIEHKAGYYYQNRFNNNGYFSSNGLFVTYSISMLMIEQIGCKHSDQGITVITVRSLLWID